MNPDPNIHGGLGGWLDALPAWARAVLVGVQANASGITGLSAAGQLAVAAILDLPAQRERLLRQFNEATSLEAFLVEMTNAHLPEGVGPLIGRQIDTIRAGLAANDSANEAVYVAYGAMIGAGIVIPDARAVNQPGLGAWQIVVGVIGAVAIVAYLGAGAYVVTNWHRDAMAAEASARDQGAYLAAYKTAVQTGTTPPPPPSGTGYRPPAPDPADKAVTGLLSLGGLAIAGWLLIQFMKSRKGAKA